MAIWYANLELLREPDIVGGHLGPDDDDELLVGHSPMREPELASRVLDSRDTASAHPVTSRDDSRA